MCPFPSVPAFSAFEFGLLNAMMGVRKMLSLIFSREATIQNSVVTAYKRLYIDPPDDSEQRSRNNEVSVVRNLTALVSGATIGDLAGLEELIGMLVKDKSIDKPCFQVLWQVKWCFYSRLRRVKKPPKLKFTILKNSRFRKDHSPCVAEK